MPVPAISKRFGAAVRRRRTGANLTQEKLAELAGIHPTYVGMVERGIRNPTLDVAARFLFKGSIFQRSSFQLAFAMPIMSSTSHPLQSHRWKMSLTRSAAL